MRTALHRDTLQTLDAQGYEAAYGKPVDQWGKERVRPDAICDICRQDVFLRAEHSKFRTPNFVHYENGPYCPAKSFNADTYRALNPAPGNPEAARRSRADFFATWRYHWLEFDRVIDYGSIHDFIFVLVYADRHGIWRYRDMRVQDVLPVLMTLMDFPPLPKHKRHLRNYGLRFFYTGSLANTDQYWNLPAHQRSLTKAVFAFPGRTRTFQEDNIFDKPPVLFDAAYIAARFERDVQNQPPVTQFVVDTMTKKFPGELAGQPD